MFLENAIILYFCALTTHIINDVSIINNIQHSIEHQIFQLLSPTNVISMLVDFVNLVIKQEALLKDYLLFTIMILRYYTTDVGLVSLESNIFHQLIYNFFVYLLMKIFLQNYVFSQIINRFGTVASQSMYSNNELQNVVKNSADKLFNNFHRVSQCEKLETIEFWLQYYKDFYFQKNLSPDR